MKKSLIITGIIALMLVLSSTFAMADTIAYDFETGTTSGWEADTTADFLNNLSAPSASTSQAYNGTYSLAYPLDFTEKTGTPPYINDLAKVVLTPAINLVGYTGFRAYVYIPTTADIPGATPAYITVAMKTGTDWDWFETDPAQSPGGNITQGVWSPIEINFSNCKNAAGTSGQQVTNLGVVQELSVHVSGAGQATGTTTFYIDDVTYVGATATSDITVTVQGVTIGVSITGSYDFGTVEMGSATVSSSALTVTNTGNTSETFSLALVNPSAWTAVQTNPGNETYVMNALFNSGAPAQATFVEANHALSTVPQQCTPTKFAGNATGVSVPETPPNNTRSLWLEFRAPVNTTTTVQQTMKIIVSAEAA